MQPQVQLLLEQKREELNARFALARHQKRSLSAAGFQRFLAVALLPVLENVAASRPERLGSVLEVLYEQALQLALRGRTDPGGEGLQVRLWRDLLPLFGELLSDHPQEVSARLGNALLHLQGRSETMAGHWLELMIAGATFCRRLDDVTDAGLLAAWLAGCVDYRDQALAVADQLPEELAGAMIPPPDGWTASGLLAVWRDNPWFDPLQAEEDIRYICRLGGFSGFGGSFTRPPQLRRTDGGILAGSRDDWFDLRADRFGTSLRSVKIKGLKEIVSDSRAVMLPGGKAVCGSREKSFSCFAGFRAAVCDGTTLFVTLPDSYFVYLLALPGRGL